MAILIARYRKAIETNNRKNIESLSWKIEKALNDIENFSLRDYWEEQFTNASI